MKVLFLGGYGNISWWCVEKCIQEGYDVYILNRALTTQSRRPMNKHVKIINCDLRNIEQAKKSIESLQVDVVCDFICYNKKEAIDTIELFEGKIKQYIVISSAANYDRRKLKYPITEDSLQYSEYDYVANKIEMEKVFLQAFQQRRFPVTIVRPAQTYDTLIPDAIGRADFTIANRILNKKPIILFGDGMTLWTLTHASDFANAFFYLIGNAKTLGEDFHITSDELLTWRDITNMTADALGVSEVKTVFMTTDYIKYHHPEIGIPIQWHRMCCDIYDNSKIKSIATSWSCKVPFISGIKKSIEWLMEDSNRRRINNDLDKSIDDLISLYCLK